MSHRQKKNKGYQSFCSKERKDQEKLQSKEGTGLQGDNMSGKQGIQEVVISKSSADEKRKEDLNSDE